ncbi:hypothetical protein I553_6609 [Mycobacterium xenopi 4042]|uniref:Uncharacterized protein n=1 Tax=Mycobacterium xenopi 4042 TaxID=1299334 RepID=X8BFW2_MYCXE|nr:hypothetical protein I553_6609 [Mycobacterium xenopi 4042]
MVVDEPDRKSKLGAEVPSRRCDTGIFSQSRAGSQRRPTWLEGENALA